jgi:hypothetical protein
MARMLAAKFLAIAVLGASVCGGAVAAEPTREELLKQFKETIEASRFPIEMRGGRFSGPGGDFLKARAATSQFVLIGEEHGVATIAQTVRAYFGDLNDAGFHHFAIEADPWMTPKVEALLRSGGTKALAGFLNGDDHKFSVPFYSWSEEAALAEAVVQANAGDTQTLWGLDQVFIGAAWVLFDDIAKQAASAEARSEAAKLAARGKGNLEFLGRVDIRELEKLRDLLDDPKDAAHKALMDDMILSARIYQPFVGGGGLSVYAANLERENLMKRTFLARYREAQTRDGKAPRVFFKFGSNHMMRGLSSTHVPSLGNFVTDFAQSQGVGAFNMVVLCGPGTKGGDFMGNDAACEFEFEKTFPDLVPYVDAKNPTLFDLRGWKDKPKRWAHLAPEVREVIWAYDAMLFVPNGTPAKALK